MKARMTHSHVLEEGVDLPTGERAPGAVEVLPRLRLLQGVVTVEEVEGDLGRQTCRVGIVVKRGGGGGGADGKKGRGVAVLVIESSQVLVSVLTPTTCRHLHASERLLAFQLGPGQLLAGREAIGVQVKERGVVSGRGKERWRRNGGWWTWGTDVCCKLNKQLWKKKVNKKGKQEREESGVWSMYLP